MVCSPHGKSSGVYAGVRGNLAGFGLDGSRVDHPTDADAVAVVSGSWRRPVLDRDVDHGIVVPMLLAEFPSDVPVIAVAIEEWTGQTSGKPALAIKDARDLAQAVMKLSEERKVMFIASAHGSAAATPRAPLLERPEGYEMDRTLVSALTTDPAEMDGISVELWRAAGACGAGPLVALANLVDTGTTLLAYDAPFGVSYPVAAFR